MVAVLRWSEGDGAVWRCCCRLCEGSDFGDGRVEMDGIKPTWLSSYSIYLGDIMAELYAALELPGIAG